ncbi:MAG: hypothetical protein ABI779_18295 [Acidobacteriota bacterium]
MKRRSSDTPPRFLDFWRIEPLFGTPIGCVTTTYTFDGAFFEEECLGRFVGMETDASEDPRTYLIEREEKFSQVFAAVLVDRKNVARSRSLRWHQWPVAVPGNKILHAKLTVLAWTNRIRVLVGSPNLTRMGYRNNYEQVAILDFGPEGQTPAALLTEVLEFVRAIAALLPKRRSEEVGPGGELERFLSTVQATARSWPDATWRKNEPRAVFLPLLPAGMSVFRQIARSVWQGTGASKAIVTSPFYDQGDRAKSVADGLIAIMATNGEREITFQGVGREHPDGAVDVDLPSVFQKPWGKRVTHRFGIAKPSDEEGNARSLHAKCISLEREATSVFMLGSSNFTVAGMGLEPACNVEANVAYVIPASERGFWRACQASVPPMQAVDATAARFRESAEQTTESDGTVPLPVWFAEALFDPAPEGGRLLLSFVETSHRFTVFDEDRQPILSSTSGSEVLLSHALDWEKPRPPSYLLVQWPGLDGKDHESIWPVNVTDASKLPPPDELRDLPLEALVEVLTSSRPLYEAVTHALDRQNRIRDARDGALELDPHKRVDTSGYLLKRVQRVSRALEGLRERLERPVLSLDALRWRLRGPIGALALARGLVAEQDVAAPFLIAEIALTIKQVRWTGAEQLLGKQAVLAEVTSVLLDLKEIVDKQEPQGEIDRYTRRAFREVGL